MKYVTVIPARGGSKRFPGKNIYPLEGIPLLAHSILYSRKVLPDTEVYVSTDNEEIANVARRYVAGVISIIYEKKIAGIPLSASIIL